MTPEQIAKLIEYLDTHELSKGLGSEESACMVASINLAISGRLTDTIPPCMSKVIGLWSIVIQDAMPTAMRNSREFKALVPLAAGTGRALEKQRAAIAIDWMWTKILPQLQPVADAGGFGAEWAKMITEKTARAAYAARAAADAAAYAAYADFWVKADPISCLKQMIEVTE